MPLAIQIREKASLLYLLQELNHSAYNYDIKNIPSIKDVWKWLSPFFIESLTNKMIDASLNEPTLMIDIQMTYLLEEEECKALFDDYTRIVRDINLKSKTSSVSKKVLDSLLNTIEDDIFKRIYSIPPEKPVKFINIANITYKQSSIFIGGRYIKLSRRLCQTPWLIEGEFKLKNSVQELVCSRIIESTQSDSSKFLSSGREDVDVRMLGTGRPFAVELVNPKVTKLSQNQLSDLYYSINNSVDVIQIQENLKILKKSNLRRLKEGEEMKIKTYRALCISERKIDVNVTKKLECIRNLIIIQNTPLRVLHRRALSPRKRIIHEIRGRHLTESEIKNFRKKLYHIPENLTFLLLDIKSQAGTYIKEFIHGDFGRSFPNLCTILGHKIDIIALDVMDIDLEWP
ncbi:tRNA pseudouridine synthase Pus10 [Phymastichus coffea]|uniref:tRNA pseudouridine synthase Pus10 n=1 Tax=Phymastichus coffea TaxID=108790 RepID=UPI00273C944E|nr:tRNA pseudouridine synthase Pus10 [Phymastichus coffea]